MIFEALKTVNLSDEIDKAQMHSAETQTQCLAIRLMKLMPDVPGYESDKSAFVCGFVTAISLVENMLTKKPV